MTGFILIDLLGKNLQVEERELLAHPSVLGVILFARNFDSRAQLSKLTRSILRIKPNAIIAVDQEGGRVQRFKTGFTPLPPMSYWGEQYKRDPLKTMVRLRQVIFTMINELKSCGVNINFGPVLDCNSGISTVIGNRSLSSSIDDIVSLGRHIIETMESMGMPPVVKHFPGHGAVCADSHRDLPFDFRPFSQVYRTDLMPFRELQYEFSALMTAHIVFPEVDALPVTLSPYWIQHFLRGQLGYQSVIFSDDLMMGAVASYGDPARRAERALAAGCDILLACNDRDSVLSIINTVVAPADACRAQRVNRFISKIK
jgi:beta-N-acetylhexosaminidase